MKMYSITFNIVSYKCSIVSCRRCRHAFPFASTTYKEEPFFFFSFTYNITVIKQLYVLSLLISSRRHNIDFDKGLAFDFAIKGYRLFIIYPFKNCNKSFHKITDLLPLKLIIFYSVQTIC